MIFTYARVSTQEQAADGSTSIEEQLRKGAAIAALRGASTYDIQTFEDRGVSGSVPLAKRPAGKEMLKIAQKGDVICAAKLDRLFRSAIDALQTADDLKARGVDLVLIDMGADPVTANGTAKLFFGLLSLVAEFERGRIAERMEDGRKAKRQKGGHVSGPPPYGYAVEGSGKTGMLVPHPEEQKVVQVVLDLHPRMRPYRLKKELERLGFRTRSGRVFDIVQIQRIWTYHTREKSDASGNSVRGTVLEVRDANSVCRVLDLDGQSREERVC